MLSRYQYDIQASRQLAFERELQAQKAIERQKELHENEYRRFKEMEKLKAQRQYIEYKDYRQAQKRVREEQFLKQRVLRDQMNRQHQLAIQAQRLARQGRQRRFQAEQIALQAQRAKLIAVNAQMSQAEHQYRVRNKQQANLNNARVLQEQAEQERLERELRDIDLAVGTIYDDRQVRKQLQLRQLEELDKRSTELKQQMRASKVQQKALEDSLAQLSKIMGM